jgi:N-methylhydantoinase B/oxoprolinase/acetone carboxylase alpha subunit
MEKGKQPIQFEPYDLIFALEQAAEFLEREEWPDEETKAAQLAANKEGAKRIRAMAERYAKKHF